MPFTGKSFRSRHNKKLTASKASKAAAIANAMMKRGADEGEAIATANARAEGKKRKTHEGPRQARQEEAGSQGGLPEWRRRLMGVPTFVPAQTDFSDALCASFAAR